MDVVMVLADAAAVGGLERSVARTVAPLAALGVTARALITSVGPTGATESALAGHMPVGRCHPRRAGEHIRAADLVHIHAATCLGWSASVVRAARRLGRPVMMTVHLPSYPPRGAWSPGRIRVTGLLAASGAFLAASRVRVYCPSREAARDANRRLGPWVRAGWLPNGTPDPGSSPTPPGRLHLALVGRLHEHKEPQMFVDAIGRAVDQGADIIGDVVGDGHLRPELEAKVKSAGLTERLRFHGWVADPDRIVRRAGLVVLTSRHEGAPLAALEAGALGRGIVARAGLEGLGEDWPGAIWEVPSSAGPCEFADAFTRLAGDPEAVARLGSAARQAYEASFTLERTTKLAVAAYQTALQG